MNTAGEPRRLTAVARPAVVAHLLALSADDRYGRFATTLTDTGIAVYGERIDFARDLCFATCEPDGVISGFIHLAVHGDVAELGASVLPPWRRQGLARSLFGRALTAAAAGGIGEVLLATGHPAARHICAGLGYAMQENRTYPRVRVSLVHMLADEAIPM
jgi:GNAT superfamily N-acetyltransferase